MGKHVTIRSRVKVETDWFFITRHVYGRGCAYDRGWSRLDWSGRRERWNRGRLVGSRTWRDLVSWTTVAEVSDSTRCSNSELHFLYIVHVDFFLLDRVVSEALDRQYSRLPSGVAENGKERVLVPLKVHESNNDILDRSFECKCQAPSVGIVIWFRLVGLLDDDHISLSLAILSRHSRGATASISWSCRAAKLVRGTEISILCIVERRIKHTSHAIGCESSVGGRRLNRHSVRGEPLILDIVTVAKFCSIASN
jgi:hypothetical protein